jgi:hypothetical protein
MASISPHGVVLTANTLFPIREGGEVDRMKV